MILRESVIKPFGEEPNIMDDNDVPMATATKRPCTLCD